jgi:hypothetical protein
MGFKYCYRYIGNNATYYSINYLPDSLYTPEIIEQCKKMFVNPNYTQEEAELIASSFKPLYSISDTLGYAALKHKKDSLYAIRRQLQPYDRELHGEEERLYDSKRSLIRNAENAGLTLQQYCDSMNMKYLQKNVSNYAGKSLYELERIVYGFAKNKVHAMAPLIEEYGKQYHYTDIDIQEMLAQLDYKDYKARQDAYNVQQIEYYRQQIDSLSKILSSIDKLIKYPTELYLSTFIKIGDIFGGLCYIGTQESYFATAPLLLLKNRVRDFYTKEYPIGIYFYNEIDRMFKNVPLPKCCYIHDEDGDFVITPKGAYTNWKCTDVEKYLPIVYQWMLDNRGKYELKGPENK